MELDVDVLALGVAVLGWIVGVAGYVWNRRENQRLRVKELRALCDWYESGRTFLNPPKASGRIKWKRAYDRIRDGRRRTGEVLGTLPLGHPIRPTLEKLRDDFLVFADVWDDYGECADTHGGQEKLMEGLRALQGSTREAKAKIKACVAKAGG